ncbi:MAG: rsgA [Chlamydiales bacterium]|jgi:ribosome biogenesis GTPase|nr:rsgA [Chlamydiales bacterium]
MEDDVAMSHEERFLKKHRKEERSEKKRITSKDRSKYKKTDQDKLEKAPLGKTPEHYLRGLVISINSKGVIVELMDRSRIYACSLRGSLKKEKTLNKNLVIVGDYVLFEPLGEEGVIFHIEERKSRLCRADNLSRKKQQLIAANIDLLVITASIVSPPLKPSLIDRYVIAAMRGNLTPLIVINKIDYLQSSDPAIEKEKALLEECLSIYRNLNIEILLLSVTTGEGMAELKEALKGKTAVFSGQSGVGKTSLMNLLTGMNLATKPTVQHTGKGAHTTTNASLIHLEGGGWCVDTPGIKSFGIWDLNREEVEAYFDDIFEEGRNCKYPSCSHIDEKGCQVIAAVEEGRLSPLRLLSYYTLLENVSDSHQKR